MVGRGLFGTILDKTVVDVDVLCLAQVKLDGTCCQLPGLTVAVLSSGPAFASPTSTAKLVEYFILTKGRKGGLL